MKPFSKQELIGVTLIFIVVFGLTFIGLQASIRRSRDVQRKADLGAISDALHKFQEEFGFFPPSDGRKIRACKGNNFNEILTEIKDTETFDRELFFQGLRACEYGVDSTDFSFTHFSKEESTKTNIIQECLIEIYLAESVFAALEKVPAKPLWIFQLRNMNSSF